MIDEALRLLASGAEFRGTGLVTLDALPARDEARLEAAALAEERPREERLWAVYGLARRGADVSELLASLDEPRVPVPGLPEAVREEILREEGIESMGDDTDLRWFIEAMQLGAMYGRDDFDVTVPALVPALRAALEAEGLPCGEPVDYADLRGPPALSNYQVMDAGGVTLRLSRVGPFVAGMEALPSELLPRCRRAAAASGWHWMEEDLLGLELTGLLVDIQYRHRSHPVEDYLFRCWWAVG